MIDIETNVISFPFKKSQPAYEKRIKSVSESWSVRRIATELFVREDMWLNAACSVSGAYAVESINLHSEGLELLMNSTDKTVLEMVKSLAKEIMEDPDSELDVDTSFFSALGCFGWEFVNRMCHVEEMHDT